MEKSSENLNLENQADFFAEEEKFGEDYSKAMEMPIDDFGFAKKEREDNEAAALRKKFNEMKENTPEEDKKIFRGEFLKEEAERLEKIENEQIEKEEAIFDKKIREEAASLVKSGQLNSLNDSEGVRRYLFIRKSGIIENSEQFSDYRNKNENFKRVLDTSKPENLKILKDRLDIKTMEDMDNVLELSISKPNEIFCDARLIVPDNLDYFLEHFKINTLKLFHEALKEVHISLILHHSNPENFKYLVDKFQIDTIEQLEDIAKRNNVSLGLESDSDLLGNAKTDTLKYIVENYQIKSAEQLYEVWDDKALRSIIKYAKPDNLKHIVEFYDIKTLEQLKDIKNNERVMVIVSNAAPENFKTFISLCENKEEFEKLCSETNFGSFLSMTNEENFRIMAAIFSTPEKFLEIYRLKGFREQLMNAKPESLKYVTENYKIDSSAQLKDLMESEQVVETLANANDQILADICNLYKVKSIEEFKKLCKVMEPQGIFQCNGWALNYVIENKIVNANNLHRLSGKSIDSLVDMVFLTNKYSGKEADSYVAFLKKLMDNYPDSISNSLISLQYLDNHLDEFKGVDFSADEKEIFEALDKIGSITPIVFNKFRNLDPEERDAFAEKIKQIKKEMFKNKPIEIKENADEIAELIYLSYKPIGMDFPKVKELLSQLQDRTGDLKDYKFPEDGYDISISSPTEKVLKKEKGKDGEEKEKKLDFEKIGDIDNIIKSSIKEKTLEENEESDDREVFIILSKIAKAAPSLKNYEVSCLLSIIKSDNISNFAGRHKTVPRQNITEVYSYLSEAKEILGVIFKDNFKQSLKGFLEKNPENTERIKKVLIEGKQSFVKALGKNFKDNNIIKDEYWNELTFDKLAELLSIFTDEKVIGNLRKDVAKEMNKIMDEGAEDQKTSRRKEENTKLKAYISKNVGSFFAKASAGICTANDIALFNRSDHFHINLAKEFSDGDEMITGNNQAYIIDDNGGKSLLIRGINPNSDFIFTMNIEALCDKIIGVGKQFQKDNNLKEVYLSDQLDNWHALSNREQVFKYLNGKYLKKENEKKVDFNITAGAKI